MGRALTSARLRWQEPVAIAAAGAALALTVVPPLVQVGGDLLSSGSSLGLLGNARLWWLLARSVGLAASVTVISLLVGVPLGVIFARAALPLRKVLFAAHLSIAFLPPFLPALGWFHLFGREGWLGADLSSRVLFGNLGVALVMAA
ncbi:MAG: hypothetical protein ACREVR_12040, partial [Burkholderiales bacterium]